MIFETIAERPPRNRASLGAPGDDDLEAALLNTFYLGNAIRVPLAFFHTSPAKGRLWKRGWRVLHRVLPDRESVAAWVERGVPRLGNMTPTQETE